MVLVALGAASSSAQSSASSPRAGRRDRADRSRVGARRVTPPTCVCPRASRSRTISVRGCTRCWRSRRRSDRSAAGSAESRQLYVRVRLDARITGRTYRAVTSICRQPSGAIVAAIDIAAYGDPAEWVAHEFEHLIEQLDGVDLHDLERRGQGAWKSGHQMFETERAVSVGRRVSREMREPGDRRAARRAGRGRAARPSPPCVDCRSDHRCRQNCRIAARQPGRRPDLAAFFDRARWTRSCYGAPISVLFISSCQAHMSQDQTPGTLMSPSTVANWMEPAEEHASEVRKLSTLLEVSQALVGHARSEGGLQRVLEILGRHHGAVRSTVVLLNEQTGDVELEASAGAIARGKRVRYRVGEGITGQVVAERQADRRAARQPRADVPATAPPTGPSCAQQELSFICVPITLERQDGRRARHRSAVQGRARLRPHREVPRRRRRR